MKLSELLKDTPHTLIGCDGGLDITGICRDSRRAAPGSVFVAIRGYQADGHRFVPRPWRPAVPPLSSKTRRMTKDRISSCQTAAVRWRRCPTPFSGTRRGI